MILFIVFCLLTIIISLNAAFISYRYKNGLIKEKKADKQMATTFVFFVISAIATIVELIINFKILTLIIFAITVLIIITISLVESWKTDDEYELRSFCVDFISFVVIVALSLGAILLVYWMSWNPSDKEIKDFGSATCTVTTKVEAKDISTEERIITINTSSYKVSSPEKTYFLVVDFPELTSSNKFYSFFVSDDITEKTTQKTLNSYDVKINYIPQGEKPYFEVVEYEYTYHRPNDPWMRDSCKEEVYNIYVPKEDILYGEYDDDTSSVITSTTTTITESVSVTEVTTTTNN